MSRVVLGTDKTKLRPQTELYIALEKLDFSWYRLEVEHVRLLWEEGLHLADIAREVVRDPDEVTVLLMDLARRGKIEQREGGAYGS